MFYVHEEFPEHAKWESVQESDPRLYVELVGFWAVAGCDCRRRLTDGRISLARLERVTGLGKRAKELAEILCALRFWDRADDGYQFHDWEHVQETKEQVQKRRLKWKSTKRSQRESEQVSKVDTTQDTSADSTVESSPESTRVSQTNRRGVGWEGENSSLSDSENQKLLTASKIPWLRVWQLYESITEQMQGAATSFESDLRTIAAVCTDRAEKSGGGFDATAERCIRGWLADDWVRVNSPTITHLAKKPGKYLDPRPVATRGPSAVPTDRNEYANDNAGGF